MATISGSTNEKVFSIQKWLGLNEHPDGDTRLKMGEASEMVNFRITKDGNLKRRPGLSLVEELRSTEDTPVTGMWSGYVGGKETMLAACDGHLWKLYDDDTDTFVKTSIGEVNTTKGVTFFPFDNKVYILNGFEYYVYDGTTLTTVVGYDPLIMIAIGPLDTKSSEEGDFDTASEAGTTTGEYVNRLIPKRRVWISPDGDAEHNSYQLPEKDLKSIDYVKNLATGELVISGWTGDATTGKVTFSIELIRSVNSHEIGYTAKSHEDDADIPDYRSQVTSNLYAELFSGTTDTRIFIYGDGTNRALYSGMDYDGMPRADYFPDLYDVHIGDSNTPITQMIRHYSNLIAYKTNESWSLEHGIVELATEDLTPAIYAVPVNREIGNVSPGMVRLVDNNPITAFGGNLYQWVNSSWRSANLSRDERQAKRISDRVQKTIQSIDLPNALMWDDNDNHEFYVVQDGTALVLNYVTDTWYVYTGIDAVRMCNFQGELFVGTSTGKILKFVELADSDEGEVIEAKWKSGAMDFGTGYMRKFSSMMWVGMKPAEGTSVDVTLLTDRKSTFKDKIVSSTKAKIPGEPFMTKIKLKAKKFAFYHLIFEVKDKQPPVTITNVDIRVRTTGYVR